MLDVNQWLAHYSYLAVFGLLALGVTGVPVPDELLLMLAGYESRIGHMNLYGAIASAAAGSMCGITISYLIGRLVGYPALHMYGRYVHITEERIKIVHDWFERWGKWTLTFGYYIPGFRHATSIVAGASKLPYREFAPFAYAGAALWAATFVLTGFFLGPQYHKVLHLVHRYVRLTAIILGAIAIACVLLWHY